MQTRSTQRSTEDVYSAAECDANVMSSECRGNYRLNYRLKKKTDCIRLHEYTHKLCVRQGRLNIQ